MANDIRVTVGALPLPWPDASNTGVPVGTSLTLHSGDLTITTEGQLVENLDVRGSIIVRAPGVTLRNCKVSEWSVFGIFTDTGAETGDPLLIDHCTVVGGGVGNTSITEYNFIAKACDISGAENGFDVSHDVTIQDCYVHDLANTGGDPHSDCIQTSSGVDILNIMIKHNRLRCRGALDSGVDADGTSCIISAIGGLSFTDVTYDNNLVSGGAFAIYGPQGQTGTRVKITNNQFSTEYHATCGQFGPWTDANDESDHSGNVFFPSGVAVT